MAGDSLTAEPCETAIKGWSVSTRNPLQKGVVVGAAAPLLVHQTLANREQVLVCASCHRFVGTPATQLAMLEGLSRWTATSTTNTKKRPRCGDAALDPVSPPAVDQASSRRIAVACAPPSRLPDLPAAAKEATVEEGENGSQKDEEEGAGGVWRCKGGSPCDDVYCSDRCREAALVGGHGLICLGGSGPGSPLFEFHRSAVRTSETYLIAAAAVATALSSPRSPSSPGGKDNGVDGDEGTRPFGALDGWDDPYLHASHDNGGDGVEDAGGEGVDQRRKGGAIATGDVKGIGVSLEEAEEAWSMLSAGLLYGRNGGRGGEGWDRGERALSLDFFLRLVRALGRHLAPISVPSPLVSYCARLVQASPETKARALPWLASAIETAGPFGGADGGEGVQGGEGGRREEPIDTAAKGGGAEAEGGRGDNEILEDEDNGVMLGERGLCRLVQASGAAAAGAASSPFPPLSVVGLLPPHCTPQHSCVPNVQLETFLLPATATAPAKDGSKRVSVGSGDGGVGGGGGNGGDGSFVYREGRDTRTALRVGLVTLRGVRAGKEMFAPYVALGQSVENRRKELSSRFFLGRAATAATAAEAEQGTGAIPTSPSSSLSSLPQQRLLCRCPRCVLEAGGDHRSCGHEMLKILADQALEEGRHDTALRLYRVSLAAAAAAAASPSSSSAPHSGIDGDSGDAPLAREEEKCHDLPPVGGAVHVAVGEGGGRKDSTGAAEGDAGAEAGAPAAEEEAATVGDALHGVGVALLAAGRFREACRAWKSGFREAPHHPALRAQAEKEAAYRPGGKDGGENRPKEEEKTDEEGGKGPASPMPLLVRDHMEQEPTNPLSPGTGSLHGAIAIESVGRSGGGDGGYTSHSSYASTPGGAADIFLSRTAVLSPEECRAVIRAAEEYSQANGGWTTSRHYAVPTTDLPVHVLEPVLPWFRSFVSERLFPALAEQFGLAGGTRGVSVHDAFVVRYEEGKQRHLPLHRDQSTHSFTIALNGLDQYSGGGTFFPCLGRSLRPPEGHTLSFRGDILHGGDPLLKGVRYIIACFCYYDDDDADGGGGEGAQKGESRRVCGTSAMDRRARGYSSGGGGSDVNGSGSGSGSAAERNGASGGGADDVAEGGKGIEFRSDEAFSFGFGFG